MIGYKLFRKRQDGTYGSLFINARQKLILGVSYKAEAHRRKGYAFRPGWHICRKPHAPHLSERNRVWCKIKFIHKETLIRPKSQGGVWYLGSSMKILHEVNAVSGE